MLNCKCTWPGLRRCWKWKLGLLRVFLEVATRRDLHLPHVAKWRHSLFTSTPTSLARHLHKHNHDMLETTYCLLRKVRGDIEDGYVPLGQQHDFFYHNYVGQLQIVCCLLRNTTATNIAHMRGAYLCISSSLLPASSRLQPYMTHRCSIPCFSNRKS